MFPMHQGRLQIPRHQFLSCLKNKKNKKTKTVSMEGKGEMDFAAAYLSVLQEG